MRSELQGIQTNARQRLRKEARILPRRHVAVGFTSTREQELTRLPAGGLWVLIQCLTRQVRQFEFDGVRGLLLSNRRSMDGVSSRSDVFHPDADHIAARQFAVDSQIEE